MYILSGVLSARERERRRKVFSGANAVNERGREGARGRGGGIEREKERERDLCVRERQRGRESASARETSLDPDAVRNKVSGAARFMRHSLSFQRIPLMSGRLRVCCQRFCNFETFLNLPPLYQPASSLGGGGGGGGGGGYNDCTQQMTTGSAPRLHPD